MQFPRTPEVMDWRQRRPKLAPSEKPQAELFRLWYKSVSTAAVCSFRTHATSWNADSLSHHKTICTSTLVSTAKQIILSSDSILPTNSLSGNSGWFAEAGSSGHPENHKQTYGVMRQICLGI